MPGHQHNNNQHPQQGHNHQPQGNNNHSMAYTKLDYLEAPSQNGSPTLMYHKWHPYDSFNSFENDKSKKEYLSQITNQVETIRTQYYKKWFEEYTSMISELSNSHHYTGKTVWRMVVGWGSNPAFETGIQLHQFYGFPYIPGSSVKGLLHHTAEMKLVEDDKADNLIEIFANSPDYTKAPDNTALTFINELKMIHILLGSIAVDKPKNNNDSYGPECPRSILERWKNITKDKDIDAIADNDLKNSWKAFKKDISFLLTDQDNTCGLLTCFDAIPDPSGDNILQKDVLTSHYKDYYNNTKPPSDDQNPNPILFLAVAPQKKFHFFFRFRSLSKSILTFNHINEQEYQNNDLNPFNDKLIQLFKDTLKTALEETAAGGKTAAGYGYFKEIIEITNKNQNHTPQQVNNNLSIPDGMDAGSLATRIDEIIRNAAYPDEINKEIVGTLRSTYPGEIVKWEKKAETKNGVKIRMEWIKRYS